MRRGPMVFGRELQVRRGPMVSGATGAQRANGRLSLLLVTQELKKLWKTVTFRCNRSLSLLSAGKRSPKHAKHLVFLRCLSDRLHVDVTIFPSSELQEQTGAQRVHGFRDRFWSQGEG